MSGRRELKMGDDLAGDHLARDEDDLTGYEDDLVGMTNEKHEDERRDE